MNSLYVFFSNVSLHDFRNINHIRNQKNQICALEYVLQMSHVFFLLLLNTEKKSD